MSGFGELRHRIAASDWPTQERLPLLVEFHREADAAIAVAARAAPYPLPWLEGGWPVAIRLVPALRGNGPLAVFIIERSVARRRIVQPAAAHAPGSRRHRGQRDHRYCNQHRQRAE